MTLMYGSLWPANNPLSLSSIVLCHSEHKCAVSLGLIWYWPCSHNVFHHIQGGRCIDNLRWGQCKFHAHVCLVCTREWDCSQTPNVLSTVHCCSVEDLCGSQDELRMAITMSSKMRSLSFDCLSASLLGGCSHLMRPLAAHALAGW